MVTEQYLTMFVYFVKLHATKAITPIPLVSTLVGGWRIVWELSSFHLLRILCHQELLLHFNDKVAEPLTLRPLRFLPFSDFMLPEGRISASTPSPTQSALLQLAI